MSRWMTVAAAMPLGLLTMTGASSGPSDPPDGTEAAADPGPIGEPVLLEVDGYLDSISPDGRWIAGSGSGAAPCVWDVETLAATCAELAVGVPRNPVRPSMTWSPDSQRVTFTPDVFRSAYDGDVFVMDVDGELRNLTDDGYEGGLLSSDAPDDLAVDTSPTWSPDGGRLAFVRDVAGREAASIMAIDPDGGDAVEIGRSPVGTRFVVWPNMRWVSDESIVLTTNPADPDDPGHGVWSLNPATGDATEIVTEPGRMFELSDVHPDGATALVADPALLGRYNSGGDDPATAAAVIELDLATGEFSGRPWLDASAGELVPAPDGTPAAIDDRLAAASGPQAYSPDGTMWVGWYSQARGGVDALVVGDVDSGELVGALDLSVRDLAVGPVAIEWVHGGVFVKSSAGTAFWVPIATG